MAERAEIETFAFVDIETSGLPAYNFGKTSIAEISIQSCSRKDILECKKDGLPRCLDKLVLCFNPRRRIHHRSTDFTGLDNYMLEDHNPLNENAAELIVKFFQHLRHPVCLVAHYGNGHDYKIINKAFQKLKMVLPEEILCVDSLPAFKYIDQCNKNEKLAKTEKIEEKCYIENDKKFQQVLKEEYTSAIKKECDTLETPRREILPEDNLSMDSLPGFQYIDDKINQHKDSENMKNLLQLDLENENEFQQWIDEEYDNIIKRENEALATPKCTILAEDFINNEIHQLDDLVNMENLTQQWLEEEYANITKEEQDVLAISKPKEINSGANSALIADSFDEIINLKKINETTPKRPIEPRLSSKFHTFKNSNNSFISTDRKTSKFKRELFPFGPKPNLKPYQLSSIYERCFGEKPKALHRADDDVTALLKVVVFHGEEFVKYSQLYAKPISSVPALGRKL